VGKRLQLPDNVLGHIGFAVVCWKRRRSHATQALALMLPVAREVGLTRVEITTDTDNTASQRVIEAMAAGSLASFAIPASTPSQSCAMSSMLLGNSGLASTGEGVSNPCPAAEDGLTLRHWAL
jgi:hypothetical protein